MKPFNSGDARDILTQQLGRPLAEVFADADTAFEVPVAAASLGQVRVRAGHFFLETDIIIFCASVGIFRSDQTKNHLII